MRKIDKREYKYYSEAAKECTANRVYPMSIVSGVQSGDIYAGDDGSVLFWHYCGFAYISGIAGRSFLEEVYQDFFVPNTDRRFILITDSEFTADHFSNRELLQIDKRIEYVHTGITQKPCVPDDRFIIERITAENIGDIQGRIIPSFSWENSDTFLRHGSGFLARQGSSFAAVAFSSAVSPEEVDIGVETAQAFRQNGLASYLAFKMCEEIINRNRKPVWAHAEKNVGSQKTAIRAGFKPCRVNTVIRKL